MSQQSCSLNVLGLELALRPGANVERIQRAANLVEEEYTKQKMKTNGLQSKDILLTYLALGLADDLLQMKKMREDMELRLENLLGTIEKSL